MNNLLFDSDEFLGQTTTTALAARPPIPAGTELTGVLGEAKSRQNQGKQEWNREITYTWVDFPVSLELTPELKALTHMTRMTLTYSITVDAHQDPATGKWVIDASPGASPRLRELREAAGMNVDGQTFSIRMLTGRPVRVLVGHRRRAADSEDVTEQIVRVGKL
jgi:hypothetical protein